MLKYASATILSADLAPGTNRGDRRALARVVGKALPGWSAASTGITFDKQAHRASFTYDPRPGYLYVRSRAISSRCNDNFDEFPADEIKLAYRTFIGKPVFVNHNNDNHRRARGVIIDAALHEDTNLDGSPDTWCEVLMEVDAIRFPKLAKAIIAREIDRTSMGTDVEYSLCSFCGNKATTPLEYCQHIPRLKGQRIYRTTASGEKEAVLVREICHGLRFFENSVLVEDPADPTAHFLGVEGHGVTAAQRETVAPDRKTASQRVAYGETMAPAKVDTLRDEMCPVCAEADSYDGETCQVCGFVKPPDKFMDPDLDAARVNDLRQEQDEESVPGGGDLMCPECGDTFASEHGMQTPQALDAFIPPDQAGDMQEAAEAPGAAPVVPDTPDPADDTSKKNPALPKAKDDSKDGDDGTPPDTEPKVGDDCPTCGKGKLQPGAKDKKPADSKDDADDKDPKDDADGKDGKDDGKSAPPWMKKKQSIQAASAAPTHSEGTDVAMGRPALMALADQQKVIASQHEVIMAMARRLNATEKALARLAKAAGFEEDVSIMAMATARKDSMGLKLASLNYKLADAENPAQPIPDPAPEGPSESTQQTRQPDGTDSPESAGASPVTDVAPDAATSPTQTGGTILDEALSLNEEDPTKPVSGTEDLGEGAPGQAGSGRTETDVRVTTPATENAFAETGWKNTSTRSFASLRLARLRIQSGVEDLVDGVDDLSLGQDIAQSDLSDEVIDNEIALLSKIVTKAARQPARPAQRTAAQRALVPTAAGQVSRSVPSMVGEPIQGTASAGGADIDEALFE